jgi:hypothetical protein
MQNPLLLTRTIPVAMMLMVLGSAAAHAEWRRNTTTVGPNGGVWTSEGQGECVNGTCTSTQRITGPRGRVTTREGYTTCANGQCQGETTITGPQGRQWKRSRQFQRVQ